MYGYIASCSEEEIANHITPLPGVIDQFNKLSKMKDKVMCGLVTGNVEGIGKDICSYVSH
jgi:methanogenic corrinoid protein MtbC1